MIEWKKVKFGEVADFKYGKMPDKNKIGKGPYPIFTGYRIAGTYSEYMYEEPQLIVVARGVGGTGDIVMSPPKSYITNISIIAILDKQRCLINYLYYYFKENNLRYLDSGSAQSQITIIDLKNLNITLPTTREQKAIAAVLSALDDKIELNRRMNVTLEAMARALFKSWFVDFDPVRAKMEGRQPFGMDSATAALFPSRLVASELGDIPEGWGVSPLSDIAEVSSGQRPENRAETKTEESPYPLYGGAGIMAYTSKYIYDKRTIVTGRVGTLGKLMCVSGKFWPSDNTLLIFPNIPENLEFIYFSLSQIDLLSLNRGSTQPLLTQTDLKKQLILIPHAEILNTYAQQAEALFLQKDRLCMENTKLEKTRDYLLPKLISGDIRIPDAEKFVEKHR